MQDICILCIHLLTTVEQLAHKWSVLNASLNRVKCVLIQSLTPHQKTTRFMVFNKMQHPVPVRVMLLLTNPRGRQFNQDFLLDMSSSFNLVPG